MSKNSPLRQVYLARLEGLRRARGDESGTSYDLEEEIGLLADSQGAPRSLVSRRRVSRARAVAPYVIAGAAVVGILSAVGLARRH